MVHQFFRGFTSKMPETIYCRNYLTVFTKLLRCSAELDTQKNISRWMSTDGVALCCICRITKSDRSYVHEQLMLSTNFHNRYL